MFQKLKIHFVGIGGQGMSGIAEVLLNLGYPVSGSDVKTSALTKRLKTKGAQIYKNHKAKNLSDADVCVISSAIGADNEEVIKAKENGIPIIKRAEMLAELMRLSKYAIAVAGTHGKTTTTSLIASILHQAKLDPTMIIGGKVKGFKSNARLGGGPFMVAEADESDGSFLKLTPTMAVITSIDREHMEHYQSFGVLLNSYIEFAQKVPFYGVVVLCVDHEHVARIIPFLDRRVLTYGFSKTAEFRAANIACHRGYTTFDLFHKDKLLKNLRINLLGNHNILNSLAAMATAMEAGASLEDTRKALLHFKGIERRLELVFKSKNLLIYDDYGHHPEEIKATIAALKKAYQQRLVVLFEPHRYSRTQDLFGEFMDAFDLADSVVLFPVYAAGEKPIKNVSSKRLYLEMKKQKEIKMDYCASIQTSIHNKILKKLKAGDILLTMGAGSITKLGRELARTIKKDKAWHHLH